MSHAGFGLCLRGFCAGTLAIDRSAKAKACEEDLDGVSNCQLGYREIPGEKKIGIWIEIQDLLASGPPTTPPETETEYRQDKEVRRTVRNSNLAR